MEKQGSALKRRDFIKGAAAAGAAFTVMGSSIAADNLQSHSHHHQMPKKSKDELTLIDALTDCIAKGQACIDHCMILFAAGETSVAACAARALDMTTLCQSVLPLVRSQSKHSKELMKVFLNYSKDCEVECRKHEDHHAECKACAESCAATIKAGKAFIA